MEQSIPISEKVDEIEVEHKTDHESQHEFSEVTVIENYLHTPDQRNALEEAYVVLQDNYTLILKIDTGGIGNTQPLHIQTHVRKTCEYKRAVDNLTPWQINSVQRAEDR